MAEVSSGFELTEEHRMLESTMRQFCEKELAPHVEKLEDGEILGYDIMRKMMQVIGLGQKGGSASLSGDAISGIGSGMADNMMTSIILKEISRVSPGFAVAWGASLGLAGMSILRRGTPEQIKKYGIPVLTMQKIGAWGLTEPGAGSDAFGSMKSTARPKDDGYVLNGAKTFITNAPYADVFVMYAKIDRGQPKKEQPVNAFIIEKGAEGLTAGPPFKKLGLRDSPTGEVFMDDVFVPKENLLGGDEKRGVRDQAKESLGTERSGVVPICWGVIEKCYQQSLEYAKQREQFGRPIAEFQAVQLKLANMYILLKNVENMAFRLAWMANNRKRDMAFICTSKTYAAQAGVQAALDAIQIHGGYGYMAEYNVEKLLRDVKLMEIGAGTSDINLLYAARLELGIKK
jgi:alkylation response protein AidB-like acyl-CoA dehydrogenase